MRWASTLRQQWKPTRAVKLWTSQSRNDRFARLETGLAIGLVAFATGHTLIGGVMARRSRKLPAMGGLAAYLVSLGDSLNRGDEKPISLVTIDWQKIEQAYGQPLSADVRQDLLRSGNIFRLV